MLNALILFRFDPRSTAFLGRVIIPEACRHFRTMTIERASNVPGDADFWLHVYQLTTWFSDVVVTVEFTGQTFSSNISGEQSWLALQESGLQYGEIALIGSGLSKEVAQKYGRLFQARIIVNVDLGGSPKARVSATDAILTIGAREPDAEMSEASRQVVAKFFTEIAQIVGARDAELRQGFAETYRASRRLRAMFMQDRAITKAMIFHNAQIDTVGLEPHPQDGIFAATVEQTVHGDDSRQTSAEMALHLAASEAHGKIQYHSLFAFISRRMTAATPWFWKFSNSKLAFKGYLVVIVLLATVEWPFHWVYRKLSWWR